MATVLLASAELGKQIAALLDTETPFDAAVAPLYERRPRNDTGHRPPLQLAATLARGYPCAIMGGLQTAEREREAHQQIRWRNYETFA